MEGIEEPVSGRLYQALRRAVLEHVTSERRRVFGPLLHVGTPGEREDLFAPDPVDPAPEGRGPLDQALRADVVAALLRRHRSASPAPLVWLTRPGELCLQDVDAAWLAAARTAAAEADLPLTMVVVTRQGWWDPRSGATRTWRRLRAR
ncbi:hypothetical protein [Nocardioides koreensis]|uniref:hypothetical protein n=1 Tax=Nocardioides koreensis TaxID=433651 RepID=UPI0031DE9B14